MSRPIDRATSHAYAEPERLGRLGRGEEFAPFYPRLGQSNGIAVEAQIAALEGADGAVVFGSGMAAISGVFLALCGQGDRVLVAQEVYGGTDVLAAEELPRFGIAVERFSAVDPGALEAALRAAEGQGGIRLVWLESPINPRLRVVDLAAAARLCRAAGALLVCDSTLAPPPLQRVLDHGVDLAVHSATKFLGGHSDLLAGVVAGRHDLLAPVVRWRTRSGGVLGPDAAWLLERSLLTLQLRVRAQESAAAALFQRLAPYAGSGDLLRVEHPSDPSHPDRQLVARQVPGGGSLVGLEVAGGLSGARDVARRLKVVARAPSLGGVESLMSIPADTTHALWSPEQRAAAGIPEGWLRVSVGLEPVDHLAADLIQALRIDPAAARVATGG